MAAKPNFRIGEPVVFKKEALVIPPIEMITGPTKGGSVLGKLFTVFAVLENRYYHIIGLEGVHVQSAISGSVLTNDLTPAQAARLKKNFPDIFKGSKYANST